MVMVLVNWYMVTSGVSPLLSMLGARRHTNGNNEQNEDDESDEYVHHLVDACSTVQGDVGVGRLRCEFRSTKVLL